MCEICQEREDEIIDKAVKYQEKKRSFRNLPHSIKQIYIESWRRFIRDGLACPELLEKRKAKSGIGKNRHTKRNIQAIFIDY